jgi:Na+/H+ antiporter NhaC
MKFNYGPMKLHEINANNGDLFTSGDAEENNEEEVPSTAKAKVIDLLFPIVVLIGICVYALYYVGNSGGMNFIDAFSNTDATVALPWGGLIALVVIIAYFVARRLLSFKEAMACIPKGFIAMVPAIIILTMATALKNMTGMLESDTFVQGALENASALQSFLPAIIFLVACGIAFATGTSWGTFGILIPIVLSVFPAGTTLGIIGMSACLAGAVCGDHCSPISDTTIMSSAGAQCNHLNHVSTQLPYALTVAGISFVCFILAGFIQSAWIVLPIGVILTVGTLFVLKLCNKKSA